MRGPRTSREKAWLLYAATQGQRAESCSSRRALHCWRSMHLSSWQACALTSSIINCIKYIFWIRDGGVFPGEWPLTSPHCCRMVGWSIFRLHVFGICKQRKKRTRPRWRARFKKGVCLRSCLLLTPRLLRNGGAEVEVVGWENQGRRREELPWGATGRTEKNVTITCL